MNAQRPQEWGSSNPQSEGFSTYAARRYALQSEIGSGSVATVHLGRLLGPAEFARTVAIKRLRPQYARDAELVTMLLDGARLAAKVRHPNVVPTLDVVTGGELLVVMDYVHGESLATLLHTVRGRGTQTPLPIVAGIFAGVLRGLHAVREAGDGVTPCDVLVATDGGARLIDLGVGKARDQNEGDLFATSVLLWEALTGRRFLPRMAPEGFEPPSRHRTELPPELDAIVTKGLARAPAVGFANASEMAHALEGAVTPATQAQIGDWVASLAGPALDERARLLAKVEGVASPAENKTAPASATSVATRRERVSQHVFDTKRGLGPTDDPAESEDAVRASFTGRLRRRKAGAALVAVFAAAALVAGVAARYVIGSSRAIVPPQTVAAPAASPQLLTAPADVPSPPMAPAEPPAMAAGSPAPETPRPRASPAPAAPAAPRPARPRRSSRPTRDDVL